MDENDKSPREANKQKEKDKMITAMPGKSTPASEDSPLTIIEQIKEMFLNLVFSQVVAEKLAYNQGIDSPRILPSLPDEDITMICNVIKITYLVSSKMPDMGDQISVLVAKNMKLAEFMLKMLELCSRAYSIRFSLICAKIPASMGAEAEEARQH